MEKYGLLIDSCETVKNILIEETFALSVQFRLYLDQTDKCTIKQNFQNKILSGTQ